LLAGERCVRYDLQTGKPERLSRYNKNDVCERCQEEDRKVPDSDAGVEEEFSDLLHAARVILNLRITDEDKIVPTLVFAANSDKVPSLKSARESVATDGNGSAISKESDAWFRGAFGSKVWSAHPTRASRSNDGLRRR
jgi:hypothetical protein